LCHCNDSDHDSDHDPDSASGSRLLVKPAIMTPSLDRALLLL
jgi:hypothetical protein